jgi:hypothetical protein
MRKAVIIVRRKPLFPEEKRHFVHHNSLPWDCHGIKPGFPLGEASD